MSSQVGTLLSGRYRLDAQIGAGGMSTVYRAFDTVLERQVAIKLMHREIAADSDQLERFRREARAVAQLNHPHIVGVIDAGEAPAGGATGFGEPPTPYIVFEYVEGETLKDRIRRIGRLPIPEAVAYAIEIARALGAAHDRRIVHRDVKPQNVLIDEEGTAKVTDFGIARTLTEEGLTADGRVLGTTDYVSPEQALGHDVGPQSDLYSLGIVLYEMLTGDVPFHGENQVAVAMKHVREELPDVQMRRPEVSSALAAVVDHATAKDLDQRYQDDAELIADLEDVLAIETARTGQATGEATARAAHAARPARAGACRCASRTRRADPRAARARSRPRPSCSSSCAPRQRTERGTGTRNVKPPPGLTVGLARPEPRQRLRPVRRRRRAPGRGQGASSTSDPNSTWSTESYDGGASAQAGRRHLRRRRSRASPRSAIDVHHADAGLAGRDLRRAERPAADDARRLHEARADHADARRRTRVALDTGRQALPLLPGLDHEAAAEGRDSIAEIRVRLEISLRSRCARSEPVPALLGSCALDRDRARAGRRAPGTAARSASQSFA